MSISAEFCKKKSEIQFERMDHHHWMYQTPPQTWTPPQTRGVKRTISESDCDDAYSEASSKEQYV